jgi:hypothetical protein
LVGGLAEQQIQQRGVVGLDYEKEDLLKRDVEKRRADDDMAWITPYPGANEI